MVKRTDKGMPLFDRLVDAEVAEERAQIAPRAGDRDNPMTVSAAVQAANKALERQVGQFWVEGEVVELSRSSSGHVYFTLKDEGARLSAVMWRSAAGRLRFRLEDGVRLLCRGHLEVYAGSGRFQFYARTAEPAGVGAEALALEQLKQQLAGEGLFDAQRKRPLPLLPRRIGVVTSRTGAAIRDIVRVVQRRFPKPILVADTQVQGPDAPRQIVAALAAIARQPVDVVIVARGGGSAQDLAAFNDEAVVRAVAACPVPTIAAIGHEVDVSLTDLAADQRAATPSQAGELVVPVLADMSATLDKAVRRLDRELELRVQRSRQELEQLGERAAARLELARAQRRGELATLEKRLAGCHPRAKMTAHRAELRELEQRCSTAMQRRHDRGQRALAELAARMHAMSPLQVLQRGYAIARAGEHVLTSAAQVDVGASIEVRLAAGALDCTVERTREHDEEDDQP